MGEILFGLIMTLTFTLAAGIVIEEEGRAGAREMLLGILGCNLAWGIIDGVLYVLGQVFERGRIRRIGFHLRQATSDEGARRMARGEVVRFAARCGDSWQPRQVICSPGCTKAEERMDCTAMKFSSSA